MIVTSNFGTVNISIGVNVNVISNEQILLMININNMHVLNDINNTNITIVLKIISIL